MPELDDASALRDKTVIITGKFEPVTRLMMR